MGKRENKTVTTRIWLLPMHITVKNIAVCLFVCLTDYKLSRFAERTAT